MNQGRGHAARIKEHGGISENTQGYERTSLLIRVKRRIDEESKGSKCRYVNFLSLKK